MGRNKFSEKEIQIIGKLLKRKCSATRFQQKQIRHILRVDFEFNISDFGVQGKSFGYDELQECVRRGRIVILDEATIADMKAKRARDKEHDALLAQENAPEGETTNWEDVLREWNEYYDNHNE